MSTEFRPEDYIRTLGTADATAAQEAAALKPQPNLGYTLLLLLVGFIALLVTGVLVTAVGIRAHMLPRDVSQLTHGFPKTNILIEALTFAVTALFAALVFPRMWHRSFGEGIGWRSHVAWRYVGWLVPGGVLLSIMAQLLESRLNLQKEMPIDEFFRHPSDVWVVALFGTLVAPACEEIFFRGFLLRGLAIAWDWCAHKLGAMDATVPGTPLSNALPPGSTPAAWIAAGIVSSGLFAAMHAKQLGFAWSAVAVLWLVGGALTAVRIRLNSVAASTVVHAVYNGWIFVIIFFYTGAFRHLDKLGTR